MRSVKQKPCRYRAEVMKVQTELNFRNLPLKEQAPLYRTFYFKVIKLCRLLSIEGCSSPKSVSFDALSLGISVNVGAASLQCFENELVKPSNQLPCKLTLMLLLCFTVNPVREACRFEGLLIFQQLHWLGLVGKTFQ